MDELLKYKIGITLIKGIGPALAKNLIAYLGGVEAVFKENKKALAKIPGIGEVLSGEIARQEVMKRAEEEIEFILQNNIAPLYFHDKNYPYRLKECADSPTMIYYKGNVSLNDGKFLAIIGTRNATEEGKSICRQIVSDMKEQTDNLCIISGLAYGIDICAHKAALDLEIPTSGVMGHGLDRIYPSLHRPVAVKMVNNGGLLTEYMTKTNPDRQNFVQRNRIVAGLCDALLVVESGVKGGALITAEAANEYNRDVFAIPGKVNDEFSAGCNKLIKENKASLVENAEDIMRFMNWEERLNSRKESVQTLIFEDLNEEETLIISELRKRKDGINVNELALIFQMPFNKLSSKLLEMEFKELVKCLPGGVYRSLK